MGQEFLSLSHALRRRLVATVVVVSVHTVVVVAASSRPFFYVVVGSAQRIFRGSIGEQNLLDDVKIYFEYASQAANGRVPYRDFVIEYPILAYPLFLLPRLVASSLESYQVAFGAEMLLCDALLVWLVASHVERVGGPERVPGILLWYTLFLAAFGPLPVTRFDLAPTLLAFWAGLTWSSGRAARGGIIAGAGTLMKIFPIVIAAPAFVSTRRGWSRWRGVAALGLTVTIGSGLWFAIGGTHVADSLGYHLDRGLELGSISSNVLILWGKLFHSPLATIFRYGNLELECPASQRAAACAPGFQALALLLAMLAYWRSGMRDGLRFAGAAILGMVVAGKVLSPQYLIWLLPFASALNGRVGRLARPTFLAACVMNFAVYPWSFMGLRDFSTIAIAILTVRNALLLLLWGIVLFCPEITSHRSDVDH
jgi:hypothetical protein